MLGEVDPASRGIDRAMPSPRLDARRKRQARDREADQLALTAAQTPHRIAHQQNLREVIPAQCRPPEGLAGAELALDRNAVKRVQSKIRGVAARGVRALLAPAAASEFIAGFHLQRLLFSGSGRSNSFSAARRGVAGLRGVRIG